MAESTLAVAYRDLRADVAFFLGYGRGEDFGDKKFTKAQENDLAVVLKSGLRQFYNPPPMNGVVYRWSFLRPVADLTLASGENTVALPDDFAGFEGRITVSGTQSQSFWAVTITGEGRIREMFARLPGASGQPQYAAEQVLKGTNINEGQRRQLFVYPTADGDYTLTVAYYILPDFLSGTKPYAYGGAQHAETLLESCLAIAEQKLDDAMGVHTEKFHERLAASIAADQASKPANLGYNADRSDGREGWLNWRQGYLNSQVGYNGTIYTE